MAKLYVKYVQNQEEMLCLWDYTLIVGLIHVLGIMLWEVYQMSIPAAQSSKYSQSFMIDKWD